MVPHGMVPDVAATAFAAAHPAQAGRAAAQAPARRAAFWGGGWHESSAELRRGLQVIEHDWPAGTDCELLMDLVSFE
jgi:hypothetical protein